MAAEQRKIDWSKFIETAITREGKIGTFYSAFHEYSFLNRLLFMMQGIQEPVASASRWRELGRTIRVGTHKKEVVVPILINEKPPEDETPEEKKERVARLVGFKVIKGVLALSDTEGAELPPQPTPGWDLQTAKDKLGVREVPFRSTDGNIQGYSIGTEFAINPVAANRNKTVFHEIGHIVLGHTIPHHYEEYQAHRGIMEFQAESVAMLCMKELDLLDEETAATSRGYLQHWLDEETPPDRAIQQVFVATDRILRAGKVAVEQG